MFSLQAPFQAAGDQPQAIETLVQGFNAGKTRQTLLGVTGSGKTFTMAHTIAALQRTTLILAPNKTLAAQLYSEMRSFFPNNAVSYFVSYYDYYQPEAYVPSRDLYIEKEASINDQIDQMRLAATKALLERPDTIVIGSVSAIYGLGDPEAYLAMRLTCSVGHHYDIAAFTKTLVQMQYLRQDRHLTRGTFRLRGDTLDIFPGDEEERVLRLQFFDTLLEKMVWIDPLTQTRLQEETEVTLFPKTHYVTPRDRVEKAIVTIKEELQTHLKILYENQSIVEAERLKQRVQYDLEMLQEIGYCHGIENYSRHFSGRPPGFPPPTLIDYLPNHALLIIDESHVTLPQLAAMAKGDAARKETLVRYGFRLPSARDNRPLTFEEFEARMPDTLFVSATPGNYELENSQSIAEQIVRPTGLVDPVVEIRPLDSQVDDLLSEIHTCTQRGHRVLVTTLTKKMAEHLTAYYADQGIRVRYLHSDVDTLERVALLKALRMGEFDVLVGINLLREGLDLPEVGLVAILDADQEGFLRSTRSLIQTVGRAARHAEGRAILYAQRITPSMKAALEEMDRRRVKQLAYNQQHGIVPKSVAKPVLDLLDAVAAVTADQAQRSQLTQTLKQADASTKEKTLQQLEAEMLACAERLEFEQAMQLRDWIKELKSSNS